MYDTRPTLCFQVPRVGLRLISSCMDGGSAAGNRLQNALEWSESHAPDLDHCCAGSALANHSAVGLQQGPPP